MRSAASWAPDSRTYTTRIKLYRFSVENLTELNESRNIRAMLEVTTNAWHPELMPISTRPFTSPSSDRNQTNAVELIDGWIPATWSNSSLDHKTQALNKSAKYLTTGKVNCWNRWEENNLKSYKCARASLPKRSSHPSESFRFLNEWWLESGPSMPSSLILHSASRMQGDLNKSFPPFVECEVFPFVQSKANKNCISYSINCLLMEKQTKRKQNIF